MHQYIRTAMTDELLAADPGLEETWMRGALLGKLEGSGFMTGADLRVDGGHCASA
jgi:hypothetical protein